MTDLVITYVDGTDENWFRQYSKYAIACKRKVERNGVRFRSWDTLQYIFRSIEENMSFINNVFLVVSSESQVPKWINKNMVKVITHDMIIPPKLLPTFNSNTIEMFIHNIPNLSEQFIYTNDDIFAINKMSEDDFYNNGIPIICVRERQIPLAMNIYRKSLVSTLHVCEKFNEYKLKNNIYLRSNHSMNPMLKSTWRKYFVSNAKDILMSLSRFREPKNITQELSNFHHYLYNKKNNYECKYNRKTAYFSFKNRPSEAFRNYLFSKDIQLICMNDSGVLDFNIAKRKIHNMLEEKFPNKSKYEL